MIKCVDSLLLGESTTLSLRGQIVDLPHLIITRFGDSQIKGYYTPSLRVSVTSEAIQTYRHTEGNSPKYPFWRIVNQRRI